MEPGEGPECWLKARPTRQRALSPRRVQDAPREMVGHDVAIAHAEEGRAQRRHHGHAVQGILDGTQDRQYLVDLLAIEERLAALHREAQRGPLEGILEDAEMGEAPHEHHHVAGAARAQRALLEVAHPTVPPRDAGEEARQGLRLRAQHRLAFGVGRIEGQRQDRGTLLELGRRNDRFVSWLSDLLGLAQELREGAVHEAQDRGPGAEVLGELQQRESRVAPRAARHVPEQRGVGTTEAIDRLLGITHHDQVARPVASQQERHLDLERVGILELVDQQMTEARTEVVAHRLALAERGPRLAQEVQEVEHAALGLPGLVQGDDLLKRADQAAVETLRRARPERVQGRLHLAPEATGLLERLLARPVALVAEDAPELKALDGEERVPERVALLGLGFESDAAQDREAFGERIAGSGIPCELEAAQGKRRDEVPARLGLRGALRHQGLEVALLQQAARETAERCALPPGGEALERDLGVQGLEQQLPAGARQAALQPGIPGFREQHVGLALVGHPEAGHHAALERALLQHGGAQRVDGRDRRALEHVEGGGDANALDLPDLRGRPRPLEALPEAQLHGGGGVLGEGHRGDLGEERTTRADEPLDSVHEQGRLAGAGAGLQDQARLEVAAGAPADLPIDRVEAPAHPISLSRSTRLTNGSSRLRPMRTWSSGLGPHTSVKSHSSQAEGSWTNRPDAIASAIPPTRVRKPSPTTAAGSNTTR